MTSAPQQSFQYKGPNLPDYEHDGVTREEQEHYLDALLTSQISLARTVCSDTPFAAVLQQKLIVLQRIFYAVWSKHHEKEKASIPLILVILDLWKY